MEAGNFDGVGAHRRRVVEGKSGAARAEPSIRRHGAVRDGETEQVWDPGGRCCGGAAEPRRRRGPLAAELGVAVWLGFLVARWWKMRRRGVAG